ncbi:MAG TPA: hypothetical protein IAA39_08920 [Candidatus Olsenella avistercoris]|nr:hypothetical protein [Candidatus Olsenella avistercoris]
MAEEHLTEELLERLRASARPEAYLDEGLTIDRKLSDYLYELLAERGLKRSTIIIWCIEHGMSCQETDDELFRLGEKALLATGQLG